MWCVEAEQKIEEEKEAERQWRRSASNEVGCNVSVRRQQQHHIQVKVLLCSDGNWSVTVDWTSILTHIYYINTIFCFCLWINTGFSCGMKGNFKNCVYAHINSNRLSMIYGDDYSANDEIYIRFDSTSINNKVTNIYLNSRDISRSFHTRLAVVFPAIVRQI